MPQLNQDLSYDPPIPTAVEDQLGLRLEPHKVPVEMLIIDNAEMPIQQK